MTARLPPTKAQLDALRPQLEAYALDWAERECTSFDAAVLGEPNENEGDGSIWDMPAIDSKRVTSLLAELEKMFEKMFGGNFKLPVSAIKSGGYSDGADLVAKLFPKIREKCSDSHKPGVASASAAPPPTETKSPPPQVLP
jgi:hypothetical protein